MSVQIDRKSQRINARGMGSSIRDIAYWAGLVLQAVGAAVLAVLYPLEQPFYTAGIMLFETGAMISTSTVILKTQWLKGMLVGIVFLGLALQVAGFLVVPEQYAGTAIIAGIGLVAAGAAAAAGREAYRFGFVEGWVLLAGFPLVVFVNLFGKENRIFNTLGFSMLFLMLLSLAGRKVRKRLPSSCSAAAADLPSESKNR